MAIRRRDFIPDDWQAEAGSDRPLPIGYGQTISQPSLVDYMTEQLGIGPDARVLEIGTGSGYQAAILAERVAAVYSVEIVPELAKSAGERLSRLGFDNVFVRQGDGYQGWPEEAPFDAIVVTAAAPEVPEPLGEQLAPGGRMVIPVGPVDSVQQLMLVERDNGGYRRSRLMPVRFVPFTRQAE